MTSRFEKARHRVEHALSWRLWIPWLKLQNQGIRLVNRIAGRPTFTVVVGPDQLHPISMQWKVLQYLGVNIVSESHAHEARLSLRYEVLDSVPISPRASFSKSNIATVNESCVDISKSTVMKAFEAIFGYSISVDPLTYSGKIVEKTESNGHHREKIIIGPIKPRSGYVYQKYIEATAGPNQVTELRVCIVSRTVPLVYKKTRAHIAFRADHPKVQVKLVNPQDVFSDEEVQALLAMAESLGLEMGEMDVIRSDNDGQLYVLDVNSTACSPPTGWISIDAVKAVKRMSKAFKDAYMEADS